MQQWKGKRFKPDISKIMIIFYLEKKFYHVPKLEKFS